jgi:GcrA cell cycle regulator
MSFVWKDAWVATLESRLAAGDTHAAIAVVLNDTFGTRYNSSTVCKKISRMRMPFGERVTGQKGWPDPIKQKLTELYNHAALLSYADLTSQINAEFGTDFSRNAVIGQSRRLGLKGKKPASTGGGVRRPRMPSDSEHRPRIRIIRANGNTTQQRIIVCTETAQPKLRAVDIVPLNLTLDELERGHCRQPFGDGPFLFCGHPVREGSSYCRAHHSLNYTAPIRKNPPVEYRHWRTA